MWYWYVLLAWVAWACWSVWGRGTIRVRQTRDRVPARILAVLDHLCRQYYPEPQVYRPQQRVSAQVLDLLDHPGPYWPLRVLEGGLHLSCYGLLGARRYEEARHLASTPPLVVEGAEWGEVVGRCLTRLGESTQLTLAPPLRPATLAIEEVD